MRIESHNLGGFTLIEMLVAVGLFVVVMLVAMGSLVAVIGADRRAQSIETVVNNLDFAMDDVSRTVRTGINYYCGTASNPGNPPSQTIGKTMNCQTGGYYIGVIALPSQDEVVYWFNNDSASCGAGYAGGCIEKNTYSHKNSTWSGWLPLTSPELMLHFSQPPIYVIGAGAASSGDFMQPKVTVLLSADVPNEKGTTKLRLQTSMTQRLYDM